MAAAVDGHSVGPLMREGRGQGEGRRAADCGGGSAADGHYCLSRLVHAPINIRIPHGALPTALEPMLYADGPLTGQGSASIHLKDKNPFPFIQNTYACV